MAFEARMYDPNLGIWISPDPAGQFDSPYLAMGNQPQQRVDPDGRFLPQFLAGAAAGALWEMGGQMIGIATENMIVRRPLSQGLISKVDWADVIISGAEVVLLLQVAWTCDYNTGSRNGFKGFC